MAFKKYGHDIDQCEIATQRVRLMNSGIGQSACKCKLNPINNCKCLEEYTEYGVSHPLNKAFFISLNPNLNIAKDSLKILVESFPHNLTLDSVENGKANTLSNIKTHLKAGHPIIAFYRNNSGATHIVLITGFTDFTFDNSTGIVSGAMNNQSYLFVNNPLNNKLANCKFCYHWILTGCDGQNTLPTESASDLGTFNSLVYLALVPKIRRP